MSVRLPRLREVAGTIRFRVAALAALAVLVVLSAAGIGLVLAQRAVLTDNLDETLTHQADVIAATLASEQPIDAAGLPDDDIVVLVVGSDGATLAASPSLAGLPPGTSPQGLPSADTGSRVATVEVGGSDGTSARLLTRTVAGATIYVAGSLDDVEESTRALVGSLIVAVPLSAAMLAGVVWWSVGRTLRPVDAIRAQVERISGTRLDRRVPEPATHDEIARLARTMNDMLDRLDSAAQSQRRFVADASHELRTPLARIRSELEVDLAHPHAADPAATQLSVLAETVNLERLVDDLLLLARVDAADVDTRRRAPVDLDDVVTTLASRIRSARLHVDTRDVAPVQVVGDRRQIERAVANLLDNAARHAHSSIVLTLARTPDSRAVLAVADDGPGIPPEQSDVIFERFTRLDDARHTAHGGAGLGLAIARDIARRHGGTLRLDPQHRAGARFVLALPAGNA